MDYVIMSAFNALRGIDTAEDLRKNKLTLSDYQTACAVMVDYIADGTAKTFNGSVAAWFKAHGFTVNDPAGDDVNYTIALSAE